METKTTTNHNGPNKEDSMTTKTSYVKGKDLKEGDAVYGPSGYQTIVTLDNTNPRHQLATFDDGREGWLYPFQTYRTIVKVVKVVKAKTYKAFNSKGEAIRVTIPE